MSSENGNSELINAILQGKRINFSPDDDWTQMLQQVDSYGCNAVMYAVRYNHACLPILLDAIPKDSKHKLFAQVTSDGWNAVMLAARYNPEYLELLLKAMPEDEESKHKVFTQVDSDGWNAVMSAARYNPEYLELLLKAMSEDLKKQVFNQVTTIDNWNDLIIAASYNRECVKTVLDAMPQELIIRHFKKEGFGFTSSSRTIEALFSTGNSSKVLELLNNNLIPKGTNAFKCVVKHKQKLLDCILEQEDMNTKLKLLKAIFDNDESSPVSRVFHTSRGILAPRKTRGILGKAIKAYNYLLPFDKQNKIQELTMIKPQDTSVYSEITLELAKYAKDFTGTIPLTLTTECDTNPPSGNERANENLPTIDSILGDNSNSTGDTTQTKHPRFFDSTVLTPKIFFTKPRETVHPPGFDTRELEPIKLY